MGMLMGLKGTGAYRIEPATAQRWDDVVSVMGTRGDPATCWCQFFHLRGRAWDTASRADKRGALEQQVCGGEPPPGLLAYDDDGVVGWCQIGPKGSFARLAATMVSRPPADELDPDRLWAVTCFVVPVAQRGRGVASALLISAADFARQHSAGWLEGYPVVTGGARRPSADLYHGTVTMFARAGFSEVRRPTGGRAVMRLSLA
jgi:GNAT superfamily N-acetyltransferase